MVNVKYLQRPYDKYLIALYIVLYEVLNVIDLLWA